MAESIAIGASSSRARLSSLGWSTVQRKREFGSNEGGSGAPPIVDEVLAAPGEPLDDTTRTFMEERFGHSFGRVRVHADARAAESANAVNAEAYTVGHHIAFAAHRYDPSSEPGRRLLAHELTHTLQQGAAGVVNHISDPADSHEREAEAIAKWIPGSTSNAYGADPRKPSVTHARGNGTWLARKQTPWPPWHRQALNDIARFAGPSDGKSAESKWPQMKAYLCKLSKDRADSLSVRLGPGAPGLTGETDNFAVYVKAKFPISYGNIVVILSDLKMGKEPSLCVAPKPTPSKVSPPTEKPVPPKKEPSPKSSSEDESQCRVDVRAVDAGFTGGLVGAKHLFLVITDKVGNQYGARGGPDVPGGLFALIETDFGRYESGLFPDYDPSALSISVLTGPDACSKKDCVSDACREIDAAEVGYEMYGPNSNSVASELLVTCGVPRQKPDVWAPGWDVPIFAPAVKGTGGEEGGRPYGDDSGGGGFHQ